MNKLWVKLTLAFTAVTIIGLITVALLINSQVSAQFRRYIFQSQMMSSTMLDDLIRFYAETGSWNGVETILNTAMPGGMMGTGRMGMGARYGRASITVADAAGTVVYGFDGTSRLSRADLAAAIPLVWQGETIGYLQFSTPGDVNLNAGEQSFLVEVNQSILKAGVLAGILGIVLGVLIARGLSAPLQQFAAAARSIAQGNLRQRVPESGAQEIADLAQSFNEMAASLEQAETLRQNLVADVAHELRTPLTVLQGNLRGILDGVFEPDDAEIARLYEQTRHLIRLVNDLRELTQAEAGQLPLNLVTVDLTALVHNTLSLFEPVAAAENITLRADLPSDLPPVSADSARLSQVLHNLLANAIRHTPAEGKVTLHGGSDADSVWLAVTDTGEGIAATDLPHVFDRFYRADRARTRSTGGSGLGLAIARAIITAHGGDISATSAGIPGQGSTFTIRLPKAFIRK